MNCLRNVVKFGFLIALAILPVRKLHADEQPPYAVDDRAVSENFRNIYLSVDKLSLLNNLFTYKFDASSNTFCIDTLTFCVDANQHRVSLSGVSLSTAPAILNQNSLQSGATAYPAFLYVGSSVTVPVLVVLPATGNILLVDATTLVVDGSNHRVGIGTASPDASLHLKGSAPEIHLQGSSSVYSYWDRATTSDEAIAKFSTAGTVKAGIGLDNDATDNMNIFVNANFGTPVVTFTTSNGVYATGNTTGNNVPAGKVGEYISTATAAAMNSGPTDTYFVCVSTALTAGDWDVFGSIEYLRNGATLTSNFFETYVSNQSGTGTSDRNYTVNDFDFNLGGLLTFTSFTASTPRVRVSINTTTTYYLKGLIGTYGAGQPKVSCNMTARRAQ